MALSSQILSRAAELGLERPSFGQFVRQVVHLRATDLADCLEEQQRCGGRLGNILQQRGLLTRKQVFEILRLQAQWVARAKQPDFAPQSLPLPMFLSVCMPAYNEAINIRDTLEAACAILPEFVQEFEVVVVDDGSPDGTGDLVAKFAEHEPRVRLVRHEKNRGYGGAVTSALRAARGKLVMFTDSDGQFSFLDVAQLLLEVDGSDVVIGYRYERAEGRLRRLNAWAWSRLVGCLLGVWVRDLDCAFKLFRRAVVDRLQLTSSGACISAEIMAQCIRAGLTIRETPVMHYERCQGAPTGARLGVILRAFRELPTLWKYRSQSACLTREAIDGCERDAAAVAVGAGPAPSSNGREPVGAAAPPSDFVMTLPEDKAAAGNGDGRARAEKKRSSSPTTMGKEPAHRMGRSV